MFKIESGTERPEFTPRENRMRPGEAARSARARHVAQIRRLYRAGDFVCLNAVCHAVTIQVYRLDHQAQLARPPHHP